MSDELRELDKKVDMILESIHKMEVHQSYSQERHDAQCEKIGNHDARLKKVEEELATHKGEVTMLRWLLMGIGVIGALAVPIIMLVK